MVYAPFGLVGVTTPPTEIGAVSAVFNPWPRRHCRDGHPNPNHRPPARPGAKIADTSLDATQRPRSTRTRGGPPQLNTSEYRRKLKPNGRRQQFEDRLAELFGLSSIKVGSTPTARAWRIGQVVSRWSAEPELPVRFRHPPRIRALCTACKDGSKIRRVGMSLPRPKLRPNGPLE